MPRPSNFNLFEAVKQALRVYPPGELAEPVTSTHLDTHFRMEDIQLTELELYVVLGKLNERGLIKGDFTRSGSRITWINPQIYQQ